jgi:membrane dipeptidase
VSELLERARAIHASSLVLDLHADTFLAVRFRKADIARRHMAPIGWAPFMLHCDLPRWREGGLKAQGLGLVATKLMTRRPREHALETLDLMHRTIAANAGEMELAKTPDALDAAVAKGKLAVFVGMEGAHMYGGDLASVEKFHELGVTYVTLAHFFPNELVSSSNERTPTVQGLTPFGRDVIRELNRLGGLVDLAHVHESSFYAALDASRAPVFVSHGAARKLRDHHRNLTDDQLKRVAEKGGCVGVIFFPWYLCRNPFASVSVVVDHIEYIASTVGIDHVALGSDWDGFVWMPRGIPDAAALPKLTAEMLRRGFKEEDVKKVLGENFRRVWRAATEVARSGQA